MRNEVLRGMVRNHIVGRGIRSRRVVGAFLRVDRRHFVPHRYLAQAYDDHPVPIGGGQTVSQPYMVAIMLEALDVHRNMKVLEVGSGSGYALALLRAMGACPYGMEWYAELVGILKENLRAAGMADIHVRQGDGGMGWPEEAPFDRILVSAACPEAPGPLLEQLKPGGRLAAPVNAGMAQVLTRITRTPSGFRREQLDGCVFVPLLGKYGRRPQGE
jgi:protein-L-isoaspartate(D-aspartate) O-methyltransferase